MAYETLAKDYRLSAEVIAYSLMSAGGETFQQNRLLHSRPRGTSCLKEILNDTSRKYIPSFLCKARPTRVRSKLMEVRSNIVLSLSRDLSDHSPVQHELLTLTSHNRTASHGPGGISLIRDPSRAGLCHT